MFPDIQEKYIRRPQLVYGEVLQLRMVAGNIPYKQSPTVKVEVLSLGGWQEVMWALHRTTAACCKMLYRGADLAP